MKRTLPLPAGLWSQLKSRNPILARTAALHAALFLIALGLFMMDPREVMGINTWIKPMKLMVSITISLATVAWLMGHITRPRWAVHTIAWGIASLHDRRIHTDLHAGGARRTADRVFPL